MRLLKPSSFIETAVADIMQAQATTGLPISRHVANDLVQAVDIQIGSGNTDLNYGTTASQFKAQATNLLGSALTAVLCPSVLGCPVSEGSANVFHLEINNNTVDTLAGAPPTTVPSMLSGAVYAYNFFAQADTPYALDPQLASGYIFQESADSTPFSSVDLPGVGLLNGYYEIDVNYGFGWEFAADISANERYFFLIPVHEFEVTGIDPTSPITDFIAQLTFDNAGLFDGTITPVLGGANNVPEPGSAVVLIAGLLGLGWIRLRYADTRI
jgi:hypothetical protein